MKRSISLLLGLMLTAACSDRDDGTTPDSPGPLQVPLQFSFSGEPLHTDSLHYITPQDDTISVTRFDFYLSYPAVGDDSLAEVHYISLQEAATHQITIPHAEKGDSLHLWFGVHPARNHSGSLPNQSHHNGMAWPDPMGGGYHYLKLEGHYRHEGLSRGYALHLGSPLRALRFSPGALPEMAPSLHIDLKEWLRHWDLHPGSSHTMGEDSMMTSLGAHCKNGIKWIR